MQERLCPDRQDHVEDQLSFDATGILPVSIFTAELAGARD